MDYNAVMEIAQEALEVTMWVCAPILMTALILGLLIGMLQAATQIQEMTLSFIPKLGALVVALLIGGPWMIRTLVEFTTRLFNDIPTLVG